MCGVITRMECLKTILESIPNLIAVYAPVDFSFEDDMTSMCLYLRIPVDNVHKIFTDLNLVYTLCRLYTTIEEDSLITEGMKVIWREGVGLLE